MFVQDAAIRLDQPTIDLPQKVDVDETLLYIEPNFCYLGDMLCAGGGYKLAIIVRCGIAWGKYKRLLPVLTSSGPVEKSSMPVYFLSYYMEVKPGHLLRQTAYSRFA